MALKLGIGIFSVFSQVACSFKYLPVLCRNSIFAGLGACISQYLFGNPSTIPNGIEPFYAS